MRDRSLIVAFATLTRERVDEGFERAEKLAVYQVKEEEVISLDSIVLSESAKCGSGVLGKPKADFVPTRCGGRKMLSHAPDQEEIRRRVAKLKEVAVLVVQKEIDTFSAISLNEAGIFAIQLRRPEFVGAVLARIQDLLRLDTPGWMEVRLQKAAVRQHKYAGYCFTANGLTAEVR